MNRMVKKSAQILCLCAAADLHHKASWDTLQAGSAARGLVKLIKLQHQGLSEQLCAQPGNIYIKKRLMITVS